MACSRSKDDACLAAPARVQLLGAGSWLMPIEVVSTWVVPSPSPLELAASHCSVDRDATEPHAIAHSRAGDCSSRNNRASCTLSPFDRNSTPGVQRTKL
ncbi:hypothetical protein MTO96_032606 [Rhipicephalus appendiculatus]